MSKLVVICLCLGAFVSSPFPKTIGDIVHFGGYTRQNFTMHSSPLAWDEDLTTGVYHFEAGWIEPILSLNVETFSRTFLKPLVEVSVSPLYSNLGGGLQIKLVSWFQIQAGYRRQFYHKSLVSFGSQPIRKSWQPSEIFNDFSSKGEFAGGDIFAFSAHVNIPTPFLDFKFYGMHELIDIDVRDKSYVYDFNHDMLLEPIDEVRGAGLRMELFPKGDTQYFANLFYKWSAETELLKSSMEFGATGISLNKQKSFFVNLHVGSWLDHPQLDYLDFPKSLFIGASLHLNLVHLGAKRMEKK